MYVGDEEIGTLLPPEKDGLFSVPGLDDLIPRFGQGGLQ
jgi:hypothetical protein